MEEGATLPKAVLYYGKDEPLPERIPLRAGPLSMICEHGDLRNIRFGDREILRRVYAATRDRDWGTVPNVISNVQMDVAADSFRISYDVENKQGEVDFAWHAVITGDPYGTLTFWFDGVARATFLQSRIGLCLLHPLRECAGQPATVETVDGDSHTATFPTYIVAQQPLPGLLDMRSIAYPVAPGVTAEIRFTGDLFEMEDQRNWTDASYKTFCTPLRLGYPREIKQGAHVTQSITLALKGPGLRQATVAPRFLTSFGMTENAVIPSATPVTPSANGCKGCTHPPHPRSLTFTLQPAADPLPPIGLGLASHGQPLSETELARLHALHLAHLWVELRLAQPAWEATLRRAAAEAAALGIGLRVALVLSDAGEAELNALLPVLRQVKPPVRAWTIYYGPRQNTPEQWVALARRALAGHDPAIPIGGGAGSDFFEANWHRPPVQALDFVCYALNPQVHAFDNGSIVETLEAQADTVATARQFAGHLPVEVSTITLKRRFNPDASGPQAESPPGELPPQVDLRQMSLFAACWTVGSIKRMAESGAAGVTYYETTGWRGVMETAAGSPLPARFRSLPGSVFPMYHVFADVGEFAGGEAVRTTSNDPLRVEGLALRKDGRTRVLLANMTAEAQRVTVQGLGAGVQVRLLDETNAEAAMQNPKAFRAQPGSSRATISGTLEFDPDVLIRLLPYAVVRLDSED